MSHLPTLDNAAANLQLEQYQEQINALADRALSGEITEREYQQEMERITAAAILLAFLLAGGQQDAPGAEAELAAQYAIARDSSRNLAGDVFDGRYSANGDKTAQEARESLGKRLLLWGFTLANVYHTGQEYQPPEFDGSGERADVTETWHLGNTEQHCQTCLSLNGATLTAREWRRLGVVGIRPQGDGLACKGYQCDCRRTRDGRETDGLESVAGRVGVRV